MLVGTGEPRPGAGIERPALLVYLTEREIAKCALGEGVTVDAPDIKALAESKGWALGDFDVFVVMAARDDRAIAAGIVASRMADGHAETKFFHPAGQDGPF